MKINVPPIKSQGIKTKLIPYIHSIIPKNFDGVWIEPFMGTGAVAFNVAPRHAILCDTNPHLINFYQSLSNNEITPETVKEFLNYEGQKLLETGEKHYYAIRERFNKHSDPLDFLFLNRAGFNGMIRFNRKGGLNTPFCKKPNRFARAYITKITNQVAHAHRIIQTKKITFKCQHFSQTISENHNNAIIYCDPPYINRHSDYYNGWDEDDEKKLYDDLSKANSKFILSTWHHNDYRDNEYIELLWRKFHIFTREHFYHVGGKEKNRNPMIEAIITNLSNPTFNETPLNDNLQLSLLLEHQG